MIFRSQEEARNSTTVAAAGNLLPFDPSGKDFNSSIGQICIGTNPPRSNWCSESGFSVKFNADRANEWAIHPLLSHEYIHLYQYQSLPGLEGDNDPYWLSDGQANGVGFGMMERFKRADGTTPFSRRAMARKTKAMTNSNFSFFLGLRYYDRPLDVDRWKSVYPKTHPEYGDSIPMAGYMTGSFWRHLIRARPRGFEAYQQMLKYPEPSDPSSSYAWLEWTDAALKAAKFNGAQIWPGGVRQVYSEMITEVADFPDLVASNRTDKLRADYFDKLIWADGCQKIDLTTATAASVPITIYPYSARCLRVKMPYNGPVRSNAVEANLPLVPYNLPPPFNVTAAGSRNCKDLDLGTRGQLVQSPLILDSSSGVVRGNGCVAIWQAAFQPLFPDVPGGLEGWQTVVLVNAPSTPTSSMTPAQFTLNFARPVAKTTLTGVRNTKRGGKKTKKPLPKGGAEDPQMSTPQLYEPELDPGACPPEEAALFECGDLTQITIAAGPDAVDFARATEAIQKATALQYLPGSFTKDGFKTLGEIYQEANPAAKTPEIMQRMAMDEANGATITIAMARLAEGQTGTFPAKISVGVGEGDEISSLAPGQTETDASGCVNIMSYETTGQVTITMNAAGMLVGTLSATLYQDNNSDVPEETCRMPREQVGSITSDFTTPGSFSVGPDGGYQLDTSRIEEQARFDLDLLAQINTPIEERSDILPEDEMSDETRRQLAAYEVSKRDARTRTRPGEMPCFSDAIEQKYMIEFVRALASPDDMAGVPDSMIVQMLGSVDAMLRPFVCDWLRAGRPKQWQLPEEAGVEF
ncbi:hypothetical protein [Porphyrobacter sp. TH134]|uniref:hypothetical protein n=1 Tax=Porphyrobacter sp. TH134 TaxID=2067450 RepID=UPI0015521CD5|nr:hypothetical protein [Porphyrobacter sp. TH134]